MMEQRLRCHCNNCYGPVTPPPPPINHDLPPVDGDAIPTVREWYCNNDDVDVLGTFLRIL